MAGYCWWRQDASKGLGSDDELSIYSVPGTLLRLFSNVISFKEDTVLGKSEKLY